MVYSHSLRLEPLPQVGALADAREAAVELDDDLPLPEALALPGPSSLPITLLSGSSKMVYRQTTSVPFAVTYGSA